MMRKQNKELSRAIFTLGCVLLSALLQTYVIQSMMQPMGLLSGGFTGLAILLDRIAGVAGFPVFRFSRNTHAEYTAGTALLSGIK